MKITIAQITGRKNPRWAWLVDSLFTQVPTDMWPEIQVIFVDRLLWNNAAAKAHTGNFINLSDPQFHDAARRQELADIVRGRFAFDHIPPKPIALQGPFRQTSKDYFCASNSRNVAILAARAPYLVCADDLAVLGPQWFSQVIHAAQQGYLVCGMYKKLKNMVVENGVIKSFEEFPAGVDSRWSSGSDAGIVPWHGSGLFGCSFGLPLETALKIDGFDGTGNGAGAEDYDLGIRAQRSGCPIFLNRNMFTAESEEAHFEEPSLPREARLVSDDRIPAGYHGSKMSDHVMLNRLMQEPQRILPLLGDNLHELRLHYPMVPIPVEPQFDWRDGTPLSAQ